jgi:hypothetical protein
VQIHIPNDVGTHNSQGKMFNRGELVRKSLAFCIVEGCRFAVFERQHKRLTEIQRNHALAKHKEGLLVSRWKSYSVNEKYCDWLESIFRDNEMSGYLSSLKNLFYDFLPANKLLPSKLFLVT